MEFPPNPSLYEKFEKRAGKCRCKIGREKRKNEDDNVGGSNFELLQRVGVILQPSPLLFRCTQTIHRSPTYSSRYASLSLSKFSVWFLIKSKKFFHRRKRFCVVDLRAMPQPPRVERDLRPRPARFHVVRHRILRRAPRSL